MVLVWPKTNEGSEALTREKQKGLCFATRRREKEDVRQVGSRVEEGWV